MSRPTCIVCGKQIRKKFHSISFVPATDNHRDNHDRENNTIYLDKELRPISKEQCQRYTNHEILGVKRDGNGRVYSFKWWEGEYEDEFFDTGSCARKQGYASAREGHRWKWTKL